MVVLHPIIPNPSHWSHRVNHVSTNAGILACATPACQYLCIQPALVIKLAHFLSSLPRDQFIFLPHQLPPDTYFAASTVQVAKQEAMRLEKDEGLEAMHCPVRGTASEGQAGDRKLKEPWVFRG